MAAGGKRKRAPVRRWQGGPTGPPAAAPNPFERLAVRSKFDVLGKKRPGAARGAVRTRSDGVEKVREREEGRRRRLRMWPLEKRCRPHILPPARRLTP